MGLRKPEPGGATGLMSAAAEHSALGASRVGAELRAARERLGWGLPEVAQQLRIRLPYLEAIEEGRTSDLPGNAYAVGFLRAYAAFLGLDANEIARRFRAEAQEVNRKTELTFPAPVPERGVPAGAVVLLGIVLAAGAYAAWYRFSDRRPDPGVASVPERLAPLADRPPPATSQLSPQVASILPPLASPVAPPPAAPPTPTPTLAVAAPAPIAVPVPIPVPVTPPAPPPPPVRVEGSRLVLKFTADAYVQIREKQGQVLLNKIMRAGDTWPVPNRPGLIMTTGNAGGTEIYVDGVAAAPLGATGVVRRELALEPDAIKMPPGTRPLPASARPQ